MNTERLSGSSRSISMGMIRMQMRERATCFGDRLLQAAYPESVGGWML